MNDYQRIALVLRSLEEHHPEQPDPAALAEHLGLGLLHFQRLFSTWAGTTPEAFLHCLTLAQAREMLRRGERALDGSLASGLSGPGPRPGLHVTLETASPGALQSGGEGWTIAAGFAESPFGGCLVGEGPRGICSISFVSSPDGRAEWAELQHDWPRARLERDDSLAARTAARIFTRPEQLSPGPPLRAFAQGTPFQVRVWQALLRVPPGALVSYGHLAAAVGRPAAARAVGTAVGSNPLSYLVPCHRVIRASGALGEYHWGRLRKQALIAWECVRQAPGAPASGRG
jgi:AraC family transcriptional regulator of adaptative response/methylated-DNA-[protein]-cysteine methyltransferase